MHKHNKTTSQASIGCIMLNINIFAWRASVCLFVIFFNHHQILRGLYDRDNEMALIKE